MTLTLTNAEAHLIILSLQRVFMEIDVDKNGSLKPINGGQAQACRFTVAAIEALIPRIVAARKEADGTSADT